MINRITLLPHRRMDFVVTYCYVENIDYGTKVIHIVSVEGATLFMAVGIAYLVWSITIAFFNSMMKHQ